MNSTKNIFAPLTTCIDRQTMFDYIDHKLSNTQMHEVEKHLSDCELCTDALDGLTALTKRELLTKLDYTLKGTGKVEEEKIFFLFDKRWQVAAGFLFILVLSFLTIYIVSPKLSDKAEESVVATLTEKNDIDEAPPVEPLVDNKVPARKLNTDSIALKAKEIEKMINANAKTLATMATDGQRVNNNNNQVSISGREDIAMVRIPDEDKALYYHKENELKDAEKGLKTSGAFNTNNNNIASNVIAPNMADGDVSLDVHSTHDKNKTETGNIKNDNEQTNNNHFEIVNPEEKLSVPTTINPTKNTEEIKKIVMEEKEEVLGVAVATGDIQKSALSSDYTIGLDLYNKAQYKKSIIYFDKVIKADNTSIITTNALWYKALALIKLQNTKEAKSILQQLVADNTKYKIAAEKQLKEIK